jgi:hypothetical protein
MSQTSKADKPRQQNQGGDRDPGLQQGANLGQKDAGRDRRSDDELKHMGEGSKKS